jgi:tyrosyl-tRNA synthetase
MDILEDLQWRGLLYQSSDGLHERLKEGPLTLYSGFDPTADSLTIGNLLPILVLRRFQLAGHSPIALVGGGTGLIGDPSGRSEERGLNTADTVAAWTEKIRRQVEPILDFEVATNPARVVNNHDWLGEIKAIDFFRDVGKHFPVPYMLAKDSVASRLAHGISYTEFSYMTLQAYDFLRLLQDHDCELQIGGSDQWGNITAGSDLIRRATSKKAFGLTCPLVTKADGGKFGKSERGAVWLDAEKTSPYQFYQFWVNSDDESALNYLRLFTFLGRGEIGEIESVTRSQPEKREAQRRLAAEVTSTVHGEAAARTSEKISQALFYGNLQELAETEIEEAFDDVPSYSMAEEEESLVDLLVVAKVSSSKRQAREDIKNGAIYINGERCTELDRAMRKTDGLHGKFLVIRRGKSKYTLVR